jgi:hypothetical protein
LAREPSTDAVEVASRVAATVAAIEAATREAKLVATPKKAVEDEVSLPFKHVTVHLRGGIAIWHYDLIDKLRKARSSAAAGEIIEDALNKLVPRKTGKSADKLEGRVVEKPEGPPVAPPMIEATQPPQLRSLPTQSGPG